MPTELLPAYPNTEIGTRVLVIRDQGKSPLITKTRSEPWLLGHGQLVVAVDGIRGGYSLDRIWVIPE